MRDQVVQVLLVVLPVALAELGRWLRSRQRRQAQLAALEQQLEDLAKRVEQLEAFRRWT